MLKTTILLAAMTMAVSAAESFDYRVFRDRLPKKEPGRLRISEGGISYRSDNGKTTVDLPFVDVRTGDVSNPKVIRIETYNRVKKRLSGRQAYVFELQNGTHEAALSVFLAQALKRPVVGSFELPSKPLARLRAYHRHRLGGCHGELLIHREGIRFVSEHAGDSRTWTYTGVETVGTMNRFHIRVSTLAETFNFDLQEPLPEPVYEAIIQRTYGLERAAH